MNDYPLFNPVLGMFDRLSGSRAAVPCLPMLGFWSPDRQEQQKNLRQNLGHSKNMTNRRMGGVILCLTCLLSLTAGGCYWLKYNKLMRTHVELLLAMADKMTVLLEDERLITPTMMNEFTYPLERARDFVRIVKGRYAELQSLQTFEKMLDVYAGMVQQVDRLRVLKGELAPLRKQIIVLREWAQRVEAAIVEEEE